MNDPFRNYDAWLEAPFQRMCAEQEAMAEAWDDFCISQNGPESPFVDTILGPRPAPPVLPTVPPEADDEDHPDHAIYQAWLALEIAIQGRFARLEAERYES